MSRCSTSFSYVAVLVTVIVGVMLLTTLACSRPKPVVAPDPARSEMPRPQPTPGPTTEVREEPAISPAQTPEGAIRAGELPADVEAINRAGYLKHVFFATDSSDLSPEARELLAANAQWLKAHPTVRITIEGHADERNTDEYNLALGWRRANAVRSYLVSLGINAGRIDTISYGEERPFAPGSNEAAWAQNRRAHFVVTAR
jgi:peptidoglycan-associated lipoprotein